MNNPALFVCMLCFTSLMTSQSCFQKCDLLKDYYLLFYEKTEITPTVLNTWSKPESHNSGLLSKHNIDIKSIWKDLFKNIPRLSIDNKLRQVSFKTGYRILVTKKSYKDLKLRIRKSASTVDHVIP